MYKLNNNKQLNKITSISLGGRKEQHLLFSLVHLILCYVAIVINQFIKKESTV